MADLQIVIKNYVTQASKILKEKQLLDFYAFVIWKPDR